jgi:hypothetical protein
MRKRALDATNLWFGSAEQLGEYVGIRFGHIPHRATEPEWIFLPHTEYDGIGGLAHLLRLDGAELPRLPRIQHPCSPSRFPLLRSLPEYLKPRRRLEWVSFRRRPGRRQCAGPPRAVAWHVFDESTTTQIRLLCRKLGITVNSLLLKNLTKAVRPFLKDQSSVVPWTIPVNLRGKIVRDRDTANHSTDVCVRVRSFEIGRAHV